MVVQQWAELRLHPVCLMLHAAFATGEHVQEKQKMLFLLLLEFLLLTPHWKACCNLITGRLVWIYTDNCTYVSSVHSEYEVAALCLS